MGKVGFNFPVALSLIHYVTSWLLMAIFKALSLLPASPPSKATPFSSLFLLGAVMSLATGLANVSLQHNRWDCHARTDMIWKLYPPFPCKVMPYLVLMLGSLSSVIFYRVLICSVGFYQMAKIAVTPTIVLAEFMIFNKKVSIHKVHLLVLLIISFFSIL